MMKNEILRSNFFKVSLVFLFFVISYFVYYYAVSDKKIEYIRLNSRVDSLEKELEDEIKINEDFFIKANNLNDPEWVEMLLMKNLGVVPEGQTKVHFEKRD